MKENDWVDAPLKLKSRYVEWHLLPQIFRFLLDRFGLSECSVCVCARVLREDIDRS